jgi:hypothetical protein
MQYLGASGSFPALIVASLAALKALDLKPVWISSLGASQWGANHPRFHWLHMWQCLEKSGLFSHPPIALSLGGEGDTGEDMDKKGRQLLGEDIRTSGLYFLNEPNLAQNVAKRMVLFEKAAQEKKIKVFINIGGSWSNMERRGVIYTMAAKEVPVIHLLYVRGLTQRYGLPWDPSPVPDPGEGALFMASGKRQKFVSGVAAVYIILILLVPVLLRKRESLIAKK